LELSGQPISRSLPVISILSIFPNRPVDDTLGERFSPRAADGARCHPFERGETQASAFAGVHRTGNMSMKYWLFTAVALLLVSSSVGCAVSGCGECAGPFGPCDGRIGRTYSGIEGSYAGHHHGYPEAVQQGPPVGAVTYPYYTIRGPRDFLLNNPPTIGP
jgi:hypothetical protein